MENLIKNNFYPYVEKYINEYLHGFSKEKINLDLGEITLEKMSLRPDTINKILDEKNIPFWIKVGLITKIHIGASVLSAISEIPIEIEIDGLDILLSPSYKWIIKNLEDLAKDIKAKDIPNPLGNDIFDKKLDDFDVSIFNLEKIQEIFKDKTALSQVINKLFKSLYSFYCTTNFVVVLKIKNIHIRFEDDELINYTGDIAMGLKIDLFQVKLGSKGNMKKDSIKLQGLDIYWEDDAQILIPSNFLNSCIVNGVLQEKYYENLRKNVHFERFEYTPNTKYILHGFCFSINLGSRCEKLENIDIFDIKTTPTMVYFQLASNEMNINLYPEIIKLMNNFNEFLSQFPIIENVRDFRPFEKPTEKNVLNYTSLVENYRKNVIDKKGKNKMLVRDWIYYMYWFEKSKKSKIVKIINPIRSEYSRFYNICILKRNIHEEKKEKITEEKKNNEKLEEKKEGGDNETPTPEGTPEGDEIEEEKLIPKDLDFSARIDLLIKGLNINLHSPLKGDKYDYILFSMNGIEIKVKLTKEKFDFNFKIKTIDLGPSNLIEGQRVIIQPKSYRKATPESTMTSINSNIPYANLSAYNYVSVPNSNLGSKLTGLIKKYNPRHEEKIKVIDEALQLASSTTKGMNYAMSENGDYNKFKATNVLKTKLGCTPYAESVNNYAQSAMNVNVKDLGKTYGSVFIPRNATFAKNFIDNYEGSALHNKNYERKKNNELNISQAINDYNSYKNQENLKGKECRKSRSPNSLLCSNFNLRESVFGIKPNPIKTSNVQLNLLEIFSNTEVGALSLRFTKYNNPITIDNLSIQIGTIRLNMFVNYLLDILRIISEYKKAANSPKIVQNEGQFTPGGITILQMQEYFYDYILKNITDEESTDSIKEYIEYLRREILSKKRFSTKPHHFQINQIFSIFPKGFDFHFDYENIEVVAYDNTNKVSSKIIVPSNELILNLSVVKIFVKLFDFEIEIKDLNKCEKIIEQLKDITKNKFKVVEIVIEPCYQQIKQSIEPLIKDNNIEYKNKLKNEDGQNLFEEQILIQKKKEDNLKKEREEQKNLLKQREELKNNQQVVIQNEEQFIRNNSKMQNRLIPIEITSNEKKLNFVKKNIKPVQKPSDSNPKSPRDTVKSNRRYENEISNEAPFVQKENNINNYRNNTSGNNGQYVGINDQYSTEYISNTNYNILQPNFNSNQMYNQNI